MYQSMGMDASGRTWREAARAELAARLGADVAVFVAEDPGGNGRLAAAGAGSIARRLPGPVNPGAKAGYIQWVSTDPRWQRRGLARRITIALLEWFAGNQVPGGGTARHQPGRGPVPVTGLQPRPEPRTPDPPVT